MAPFGVWKEDLFSSCRARCSARGMRRCAAAGEARWRVYGSVGARFNRGEWTCDFEALAALICASSQAEVISILHPHVSKFRKRGMAERPLNAMDPQHYFWFAPSRERSSCNEPGREKLMQQTMMEEEENRNQSREDEQAVKELFWPEHLLARRRESSLQNHSKIAAICVTVRKSTLIAASLTAPVATGIVSEVSAKFRKRSGNPALKRSTSTWPHDQRDKKGVT